MKRNLHNLAFALSAIIVIFAAGFGSAEVPRESAGQTLPDIPADTAPAFTQAKPIPPALPLGVEPLPANGGLACVLPSPSDGRVHLESFWDNGYHVESSDKQFRLHIGGNAQVDTVWLIGPNSIFALPNGATSGIGNAAGTELRRARLRMDGTIYSQFDYSVEYDFANASNENDGVQPPSFSNLTSAPVPCNVWMQIRELPFFGNVRIGNQVKPVGMTNNTYQGSLPFMERADNQDAFYSPFDNGFALGVSVRNWAESERTTWQYGIYRPSTNSFSVALTKYTVGARVTGLPVYEDDGQRLVHVGLGYWGGQNVQDEMRARARTGLRNGPGFVVPVLVDTGEVPGGNQYLIAPEFAAVYGSWTLQAEYAGQFFSNAVVSGQTQGTVFYHGGYVELLYFLTGEHQDYDKHEGVFGRVVPRNNMHVKLGNDIPQGTDIDLAASRLASKGDRRRTRSGWRAARTADSRCVRAPRSRSHKMPRDNRRSAPASPDARADGSADSRRRGPDRARRARSPG
jgi:phosphate-selective porin OprO/OprP